MTLDYPWTKLEEALRLVAERNTVEASWNLYDPLLELGLIEDHDELTELGNRYYVARFVTENNEALKDALGDVLLGQSVPTAFCAALWGAGDIAVTGALSLLKRLQAGDDASGKRWLELMNKAGWIAYNRKNPKLRVLYNPAELVPPDESAEREKGRGHLLSPETPYGNLFALRELVRAARGWIRWYEPQMPAKVLEVLYSEVDGANVATIQLLSGPANITQTVKDDFKRFATEMLKKRGVTAEWRVLPKKEAFRHHDRFFLSIDLARNLPPLNTILANSTGEILPSELSAGDFNEWWLQGQDLKQFQPPADEGGA